MVVSGVAEHHADLLADLVDEDERGLRLGDDAGELAQRLRHEPGLQAHLRVAHLAFDFGLGHERGHRVDDDDVDAVGADQHLDDLERLLAVVGLRDQQVVEVDAELLRVCGVERVLGVDERRHAAALLGLGDDLQGERRLARGLRPEDLDDAAARAAADAERVVDADATRWGWPRSAINPLPPSRMIEPLPNCFSTVTSERDNHTTGESMKRAALVVVAVLASCHGKSFAQGKPIALTGKIASLMVCG